MSGKRGNKARRAVRASKRPVVAITDRDHDLLVLIGLCRYLSLTQAAREFYPSEDRARRRVRLLYDAGVIAVTMLDSRRPNLLSLTRSGLAIVADRDPQIADRCKLAGPIRLAGVLHHLAIVDARTYLAALGRKRSTPLVRWANAGGDLARELKLNELHLEPDGIGEVLTPEGLIRLACEIDCSTQALSTIVRGKLDRYRRCAETGRLDGLWIIGVGSQERREHLEQLVREMGLAGWARVLAHAYVLKRPLADLPPLDAGHGEEAARSQITASPGVVERPVNQGLRSHLGSR